MNSFNIKLKYYLKIWKDLPNYPTREDTFYEIEYYAGKSDKFLEHVSKVSKQIRDKITNNLKWLEKNGYIEKTKDKNLKIIKQYTENS
jgi:hypothetical protein